MKTVAVSGGFDPLHIGHLRMMQEASKLGRLFVILNSDEWLIRKKGKPFMTWKDRAEIIMAYAFVVGVMHARDDDGSVCESLKALRPSIFINGGDRVEDNTPEKQLCESLGIEMRYGVGGSKIRSSTELVRAFNE